MVSTSPRRPSRFVESLPRTSQADSTLPSPPTPPNEHLCSILTEMDEFESRRQETFRNRGASQSSLDSLPSSTASPTTVSARPIDRSPTVKEGRRSINFTQSNMDKELNGRRRSGSASGSEGEGHGETTGDKLAKKFVGRLRALTGGKDKDRDGKMYHGT